MDEATEKVAGTTASAEPTPATASATTKKTRGRKKTAEELEAEADKAEKTAKNAMRLARKKRNRAKIAREKKTEAETATLNLQIIESAEILACKINPDAKKSDIPSILADLIAIQNVTPNVTNETDKDSNTSKSIAAILNIIKKWHSNNKDEFVIQDFTKRIFSNKNFLDTNMYDFIIKYSNKNIDTDTEIILFVKKLYEHAIQKQKRASQTTQQPNNNTNT